MPSSQTGTALAFVDIFCCVVADIPKEVKIIPLSYHTQYIKDLIIYIGTERDPVENALLLLCVQQQQQILGFISQKSGMAFLYNKRVAQTADFVYFIANIWAVRSSFLC